MWLWEENLTFQRETWWAKSHSWFCDNVSWWMKTKLHLWHLKDLKSVCLSSAYSVVEFHWGNLLEEITHMWVCEQFYLWDDSATVWHLWWKWQCHDRKITKPNSEMITHQFLSALLLPRSDKPICYGLLWPQIFHIYTTWNVFTHGLSSTSIKLQSSSKRCLTSIAPVDRLSNKTIVQLYNEACSTRLEFSQEADLCFALPWFTAGRLACEIPQSSAVN